MEELTVPFSVDVLGHLLLLEKGSGSFRQSLKGLKAFTLEA
jgi:hypothetical protein